MRKSLKLFSALLAVTMSVSTLASCADLKESVGNLFGGNSETPNVGEFQYETELLSEAENVSNGYNSNLFYVNTLEFQIADPTVIQITDPDSEEYGYFYAYGTSDEIGCHGFQAWRSKDLSHWECTGVAYTPDYDNTWATNNYWAPEIIYDEEQKLYYLFYNAYNTNDNNRLCLSVAYSRHPAGPFVSPDGRRNADGELLSVSKPVFDFTRNNTKLSAAETKWNEWFTENYPEYPNPGFLRDQALDTSPFVDPETGDKYMYFSYYNDYGEGSFIYGVKMKDWFTPDYSTLTMITYPYYATIDGAIRKDQSQYIVEGGVNEGPFMVYHEGKYYMTFSIFGYTDPNYRVIQAISDSPLGTFEKVDQMDGGKVISSDTANWRHIVSAGHHCFIKCGDETFIAYHTFKNRNSISEGRALAVDKIVWTKNSEGIDVMHTNGPTWSVQPLPESLSGYKNIAPSATITANNTAEFSDVSLLNDELIKYQEFDLVEEYNANAGTSTIKLEWENYKTVRALMVYNSYRYEDTFVDVDKVEMEYLLADGNTATLELKDLPFDWNWHYESDLSFIRPGGAAIAEFEEIPVKSITLTLRAAADADYLGLSEIVVLGKDEACAGVETFGKYSYENATYGSSHIVKDSLTFGSVKEAGVETWYGYDLTHDDGTEDAYILQTGVYDQYAYFKDIYSDTFYMEAEFTVTTDKAYAGDPYPKFGIAMSCGGKYPNTIFFYVDAVNYTNTSVGCAQRKLDNSDWDWTATEQLVNMGGISYTQDNYVKLAVLRRGNEFYLLCNNQLAIYYDNFSVFVDDMASAVGFLSFNTPMKIRNYSATADQDQIDEMYAKYVAGTSGETFGKVGSFTSTAGWDLSNDSGENATISNETAGEQYAYFKNVNSTTFYAEMDITVTKDLGDSYPKFGFAVRNAKNTLFFYVDGSSGFTAQNVGYLFHSASEQWIWGNADYNKEQAVSVGKYTDGETVRLGILRDGNTFTLLVDGVTIFTLTDIYGFGASDAACLSVFSFTVGVEAGNYSITTDISSVEI